MSRRASDATIHRHDRERHRCLRSLWYLATEYLGYDKLSETFHGPMLSAWDAIDHRRFGYDKATGIIDPSKSESIDTLDLWPRDHIKTWCERARVVRYYMFNPQHTHTWWHSVEEMAQESGVAVGKTLQTNNKLRILFPPGVLPAINRVKFVSGGGFNLTSNKIGHAPSFRAWGAGSEATGGHSIGGTLDDPIGLNDVVDSQMPSKIRWYQATVCPVVRAEGFKDVIGTRWDRDDIYAPWLSSPYWTPTIRACLETDGKPDYKGDPVYLTRAQVEKKRAEMGEVMFCTPAETPILMPDWSFRRIADVKIGDHVMGFRWKDGARRFCPTEVLDTGSTEALVYEMTMASGGTARCTLEHKWFTGRRTDKSAFRPARVGTQMNRAVDVRPFQRPLSDQERRDWGWLAGIIDGEGSCKNPRGAVVICQDFIANPDVCQEIDAVLARLGIKYHVNRRKGRPSSRLYILHGGRQMKAELLAFGRPAKSSQILAEMKKRPAHPFSPDRVVAMQAQSHERVYWLETRLEDYIAWGMASSNSFQMMNDATPAGMRSWDPVTCERFVDEKDFRGGVTVCLSDPAPAMIGSYKDLQHKTRGDGTKNEWAIAVVRLRRVGNRHEAILLDLDASKEWDLDSGYRRIFAMMRKWGCSRLAEEATGQAIALYEMRRREIAREEGAKYAAVKLAGTYRGQAKKVYWGALCSKAKADEFLIHERIPKAMLDRFLDQARNLVFVGDGFRNNLKLDDIANVVSFCTDPEVERLAPLIDEAKEWSPFKRNNVEPEQHGKPVRQVVEGGDGHVE